MAGKTNLYVAGNIHGNFVVNTAGLVEQNSHNPQMTTDVGEVRMSAYGTSLSGQAAHIKVSPGGFC